MTATADYGVSIVEDFTPPKAMTPGQTVNKDVSAVNTGSVDAFVRMALKDYITISRLSSLADTVTMVAGDDTVENGSFSRFVKADGTFVDKKIGATTNAADGTFTAAVKNADETFLYNLRLFANSIAASAVSGDETEARVELNPQEKVLADGTKEANEVTTLMAGGRLMVAGNRAVEPEKQIVRSGDDVNGANGFAIIYASEENSNTNLYILDGSTYKTVNLNQDGLYVIDNASPTQPDASKLKVKYLARDYSGAGQYQVQDEGIYLFQRTGTNVNSSNSAGNPTYSGFYYEGGKFYAFKTQKPATTAPTTLGTTSTAVIDFGTGAGVGLEEVKDGDTVIGHVVKSIKGLELLTKIDNIKNSGTNTWTFEFYDKMEKADPDDTNEAAPAVQTGDNAINTKAKYIKATFKYGTSDTKPVIFWIKLDDDWAKTWTYVGENESVPTTGDSAVTGDKGNVGYFYYRTLLNSGDTSTKLVDSVTLDKNMTSENYLDLVYDLNVTLDSVQVTMDEYNNETDVAVPTTWAKSKHAIKKNATTDNTAPVTTIAPASAVIKGDSDSGTIDWINWGDDASTD